MAGRPELTRKQSRILEFIAENVDWGCPPTLQEIAERFKLGLSTVQGHVAALEAKGALERRKDKARGFRIVGRPAPGAQLRLPLLGRVPAGPPSEAMENAEDYLSLDKSVAGKADYLLKVKGDSMAPGILDGDLVLVRQAPDADNGEIVIAFVGDDAEATLKRLRCHGRKAWLEADNPRYKPIRTRPIRVVGRVMGLVRTYARGRR